MIEPERDEDAGRIRALLADAFPGEGVDRLVDELRASDDYEPGLGLVARVDDTIVGFVLVTRARIERDDGTRTDVLNLSPLAVAEPHRRAGIGSDLVRAMIATVEARGDLPRIIVLEGSPTYYGRLGFTAARDAGITIDLPDWAPPEAAQILRLSSFDPGLRGRVIYPPPFQHLDESGSLAELAAAAGRLIGREVRAIRMLGGGAHAATALVRDGERELVVRLFPEADPAVEGEVGILPRLRALGTFVPELIAADPSSGVIVTTRVPGGGPPTEVAPEDLASAMAGALARVHALDPGDLAALRPPTPSDGPIGRAAADDLERVDLHERVIAHRDAWIGNAMWEGTAVTGMVDWSGAGSGPRGFDVAWARNDLVLLGSPDAADILLAEYRRRTGTPLADIARWDRIAGGAADARVDSWAGNYAGIGRPIPAAELRRRLDEWNARLLASSLDDRG